MLEPPILTCPVFHWRPSATASGRRRNEARHLGNVASWYRSLGMSVIETADCVTGTLGNIRAEFSYAETCSYVRRSHCVAVAGERSTIRTLRALADPERRRGMLAKATRRAKRKQAEKVTAALAL